MPIYHSDLKISKIKLKLKVPQLFKKNDLMKKLQNCSDLDRWKKYYLGCYRIPTSFPPTPFSYSVDSCVVECRLQKAPVAALQVMYLNLMSHLYSAL